MDLINTEAGQCLSSNISSGSMYDYLNRDSNNSMHPKNCTEQEA